MSWLFLLLLLGGLLLAAACGYLLVRSRRLAGQVDALRAEAAVADASANRNLTDLDGMCLTVEVLNPIEVARANSRLAGPASGVSPGLVCRRVYDQMARELEGQLAERGIEARIARVRGSS